MQKLKKQVLHVNKVIIWCVYLLHVLAGALHKTC